ncbi:uncharacterized protein AB675_1699 [Cyphellophora attinorum]|uniref:Transcription factor domain-containing protein n=1 Tax=Cyphellophora attinorum TaxID=1664694 RepID=A0A0N0NIM7_9EURO|nr:uncharacterized protein AB675_1699 [Phialophora attinorum]KPI36011.1 hypothetical protein AB675_1699 [Phialophora attinorum]
MAFHEEMFLFVNTDATQMKSKTKNPMGHQIQSHVQRGLRRKLLQKHDAALHESTHGGVVAIQKPTVLAAPQILEEDLIYELPPEYDNTLWELPALKGSPISEASLIFDSCSDPEADHSSFGTSASVAYAPTQNGSSQSAAPIPMQCFDHSETLSKYVPILLQCWTDRLLPEKFHFDARWARPGTARHGARSSAAHFYSFLACIAVQMIVIGESIPDIDQVDFALWLQARATESVQASLATSQPNKELARDIQRLTTISYLTDRLKDAEQHFEAMLTVATSLGGIKTFDSYFFETEIITHWHGALRTLNTPRITLSNTVAEPEEVAISAPLVEPSAPVKHRELAQCFQELSKVINFVPYLEDAHCKWASSQCLSVGYQLLSARVKFSEDQAFRIALIYFIALIRSTFLDRSCASNSIHHLRRALEASTQNSCLYLWLTVIGSMVALGTQHEGWFIAEAARASQSLRVGSLAALEAHLGKTLYQHILLRDSLRQLWQHRLFQAGRSSR